MHRATSGEPIIRPCFPRVRRPRLQPKIQTILLARTDVAGGFPWWKPGALTRTLLFAPPDRKLGSRSKMACLTRQASRWTVAAPLAHFAALCSCRRHRPRRRKAPRGTPALHDEPQPQGASVSPAPTQGHSEFTLIEGRWHHTRRAPVTRLTFHLDWTEDSVTLSLAVEGKLCIAIRDFRGLAATERATPVEYPVRV